MSNQTQNQTREELLANLERYWCAQVGEVMRSFLDRKRVAMKRSARREELQGMVTAYLRSLPAEQLQAEGDELTTLGIRWWRTS